MVSFVMGYDKVGIEEAQVEQVPECTMNPVLSVAKLVSYDEVSS